MQAYQTSQYMVLRDGIFLGKWHSSFVNSTTLSQEVPTVK
jgi:hypothetical protein